jgi:gluconolactonase
MRNASASVRRLRSWSAWSATLGGMLVWVTLGAQQAQPTSNPQQQAPPQQQQQQQPPAPAPSQPAASADDNIPHGTVTKFTWTTSEIFPGTQRDYWVYVPAQYDGKTPACVMVFQDGTNYVDPKGAWHVPLVFDTLIQRKEMPVTIGVFINPGVVPATSPDALPRFNRSFEYDAMSDRYARFLVSEILPEISKRYLIELDGNSHAIAGASSGAIAAFTAAWEHPEAFGRVLSTIGTYVGLRGGHEYPFLIRKTEPKPLRIFLEDGTNDNNSYGGDWYLANQAMLSALTFSGYEVNHAWGEGGGHDSKHAAPILADMLRWLWHDYPAPIAVGVGSKQPVMDVLVPNEGWRPVGQHITRGPVATADGDVFFTDAAAHRIYKVSGDAEPQVFVNHAEGVGHLAVGPDGRLYAVDSAHRRIVSYDASGEATLVAGDILVHDLTVTSTGRIYATDPGTNRIWLIDSTGKRPNRSVERGLRSPRGVQLTPDQSLLYVSDAHERMVYSFQIQPDGALAHKQPYCYLHVPGSEMDSGADGMAVDSLGRLYVSSAIGVQFCDQAGRVNGIITAPRATTVSHVTFGGRALDTLYAATGDRLFRRKTKATGVLSFQKPIKPPAPRL